MKYGFREKIQTAAGISRSIRPQVASLSMDDFRTEMRTLVASILDEKGNSDLMRAPENSNFDSTNMVNPNDHCRACQGFGHFAYECPTAKRQNSDRSRQFRNNSDSSRRFRDDSRSNNRYSNFGPQNRQKNPEFSRSNFRNNDEDRPRSNSYRSNNDQRSDKYQDRQHTNRQRSVQWSSAAIKAHTGSSDEDPDLSDGSECESDVSGLVTAMMTNPITPDLSYIRTPAFAMGKLDGNIRSLVAFDSGSGITLISKEMAQSLQKRHDNQIEILPWTRGLQQAAGDSMKTDGAIPISVRIHKILFEFPAIITPSLVSDILIGNDVMDKLGLCIDFADHVVRYKKREIPFVCHPSELRHLKAVSANSVLLSPHSCNFVQVEIPNFQSKIAIFEEFSTLALHYPLYVGRTLNNVNEGKSVLQIINPTSKPIQISKDTPIAWAKPISETKLGSTDTFESLYDPVAAVFASEFGPNCATISCPTGIPGQSHRAALGHLANHSEVARVGSKITPTKLSEGLFDAGPGQPANPVQEVVGDGNASISFDINTDLTHREQDSIRSLLASYTSNFREKEGGPGWGLKQGRKFHIDLAPNTKPIRARIPRRSPGENELIRKQDEDWQKKGYIQDSTSEWAMPLLMIPKKDGSKRTVQDMRKVNYETIHDSYPLNRTEDIIGFLGAEKGVLITELDATSGFHQVPVDEETRPLTAYISANGLKERCFMPQGARNAAQTFQRNMDIIFSGLTWKTMVAYIDNIYIRTTGGIGPHLSALKEVMDRAKWANLKFKPSKCHFAYQKLEVLGHVITPEGIHVMRNKIDKVANAPIPKNVNEIYTFLGLANYYRRFIRNFADIARPLYALLKKDVKFNWGSDQQHAYDSLKLALTTTPTLAYPDYSKPFINDPDSSEFCIGAILGQKDELGRERPVEFYSRTLLPREINYSQTEKEALAIIESEEHFHPYIYGAKHFIRTDHQALQWLLTQKEPKGRIARWVARLQNYDFELTHRPGKLHSNADAMTRPPIAQPPTTTAAISSKFALKMENLAKDQQKDPDLMPYIAYLKGESLKMDSKTENLVKREVDNLFFRDDLLYRTWKNTNPQGRAEIFSQIAIPAKWRDEILQECHDSMIGGHLGFVKTLMKIRERYWWSTLR